MSDTDTEVVGISLDGVATLGRVRGKGPRRSRVRDVVGTRSDGTKPDLFRRPWYNDTCDRKPTETVTGVVKILQRAVFSNTCVTFSSKTVTGVG